MKSIPNSLLLAASPLIGLPVVISGLVINGNAVDSSAQGASVPLALIAVSVLAAIWVLSWGLTCLIEQSEAEETVKVRVSAWTLNGVAALSLVTSVILTVISSLVV